MKIIFKVNGDKLFSLRLKIFKYLITRRHKYISTSFFKPSIININEKNL